MRYVVRCCVRDSSETDLRGEAPVMNTQGYRSLTESRTLTIEPVTPLHNAYHDRPCTDIRHRHKRPVVVLSLYRITETPQVDLLQPSPRVAGTRLRKSSGQEGAYMFDFKWYEWIWILPFYLVWRLYRSLGDCILWLEDKMHE